MHGSTSHASGTAGRVIHWARGYDLVGRLAQPARNTLIDLAQPGPGERVLDVGCGTGALARTLKSRVPTSVVHGIDASPEMIAAATEQAAKANLDIDFQVAIIEALPLPDASCDLVTSTLMLHHVPDDVKRAGVAEIRRILRPGGRFLAMDFAIEGTPPLGHLLAIFGRGSGKRIAETVEPMLRDAGFTDVSEVVTRYKRFAFIRAS